MRSATGPRQSGPPSKRGQAVRDAEQAADVAGVAVGVPAGGVDDHQRLLEIAVAVQQGVDDQRVVGHHVAVAAVLVVAVVGGDPLPRLAPVVGSCACHSRMS